MAPDDALQAILAAGDLRLTTCQSHWAHVSKYVYAGSLLSAEGAKYAPGRFHRKGEAPALYFARSPLIALLEVGMLLGADGEYLVRRSEPQMLVMVDIDIPNAVLDLTRADNVDLFGTGYQELTGSWMYDPNPATQRLGKAAYESGKVAAILYPSATWSGRESEPNLVVFRDRLEALPGAVMHPVDPGNHLPATVSPIGRPPTRYARRT